MCHDKTRNAGSEVKGQAGTCGYIGAERDQLKYVRSDEEQRLARISRGAGRAWHLAEALQYVT